MKILKMSKSVYQIDSRIKKCNRNKISAEGTYFEPEKI